jgi:acetyl esterase/lipase
LVGSRYSLLATYRSIAKILQFLKNSSKVGAEKFRQMRNNGETAFPKPPVLPEGHDISIPSRDANRSIPCRLFHPASSKPRGIILHIHGGGWVLMSEKTSDVQLKFYADISGCTVVSAGYRLAPEHPFPAGPEDCFDVAEYLVKNCEEEYGGLLRFMGGEVCSLFFHLCSHSLIII